MTKFVVYDVNMAGVGMTVQCTWPMISTQLTTSSLAENEEVFLSFVDKKRI